MDIFVRSTLISVTLLQNKAGCLTESSSFSNLEYQNQASRLSYAPAARPTKHSGDVPIAEPTAVMWSPHAG